MQSWDIFSTVVNEKVLHAILTYSCKFKIIKSLFWQWLTVAVSAITVFLRHLLEFARQKRQQQSVTVTGLSDSESDKY